MIADDHEAADNESVLDFWQAIEKARAFARGHDRHGAPGTLEEALLAYERELHVLKSDIKNARRVRAHLTPQLLTKPWRCSAENPAALAGRSARQRHDRGTFVRTAKALRSALSLPPIMTHASIICGQNGARFSPPSATRAKRTTKHRAHPDAVPDAALGLLRYRSGIRALY